MFITLDLITKGVIGVATLFTALAVIYVVKAVFRPSVKSSGAAALFTVIAAFGHGDGLEETLHGLTRLENHGSYRSHVIIVDCGLDCYGRRLAELLADDRDAFSLCCPMELPDILEDCGWKRECK